jgi:hypothetical protein
VVDAVGDSGADVTIGDPVFGCDDFVGYTSAGASDYAILSHWALVPPGLDMVEAGAVGHGGLGAISE